MPSAAADEEFGDHEQGADRTADEHGPAGAAWAAVAPTGRVVAVGVAGFLLASAVLAVFRIAATTITALAMGVVLALALDPVMRAVQQRLASSRAVATIVIGVATVAVFAGVILILGPQAVEQAQDFADEAPATVEEFYSWPLVGDRLEEADLVERAEDFVDRLPERIDADGLADGVDRLVGSVTSVLVVLVTAIAVLLDGEALVARARRLVPLTHRERADRIGRIVYDAMARYFAGSVSVAVLNGVVILTAGLILGIPLAPLAGLWAAITNLIPQIGGFLGGSFFVLLAVTQGAVPGLVALVVFLGYQQFENNVIQPTVIGNAVDLTPPTTMLAALIGGAAAGVPGALVATPLVGAVKSVWTNTHPDESDDDESVDGEASDDEGASWWSSLRRKLPFA